jgi:hypothetical protein
MKRRIMMPKDKKKKRKEQEEVDNGKIDIRKVTDNEWQAFENYYIEAVMI